MAITYQTSHGLRAYDAAKWLAPPPEVRNVRRLGTGISCLVQSGASADLSATQEALVKDRGDESLLLFPDGTGMFDLYLGSARIQPRAAMGMAQMGADVAARWVAKPGRARMIQIHIPLGMRAGLLGDSRVGDFDGAYGCVPAGLSPIISAFCVDLDSGQAPDMLLETYIALIIQKLRADPPKEYRGGLAAWQVRKTRDLMAADLSQAITLAELAGSVGLSPYHFARAFKRTTGLAPHQFHIMLRIEQAKMLLETSTLSIRDIARRVGYEDPQHFGRLFLRLVGHSPRHHARR